MSTRKYLRVALCLPATVFSLYAPPSSSQVASEPPLDSMPQATQTLRLRHFDSDTSTQTLGEMVVTASRAPEAKHEVSNNVTVISSEEIKASTAATVADLMAQQGFNVATTGNTSNVQIRGMGNLTMANELENQVLILLNGHRIGLSNLALAGLANVERIEIIRGPSAVQYGSSALGGVINIITRRGKPDKPFFSLEAGIGSDSLKRQKIALGGAANGFDFSFGGTHFSRDDVTAKDGRRWYNTAIDKSLIYDLDVGYTFAQNHRIGINHYQGENQSELTASGIRPYSGNTPANSYTDYLKRNKNTALSYAGSTDDKNLDWMVNYSFGSTDQKDTHPVTGIESYRSDIDNKVFNAQLNYNAALFSVSGGVDQYQYDVSGFGSTPETTMKDTGAYLSGKLRFLEDRLVFSLALRHDRFENSGTTMDTQKDNHTGGTAGVSYRPLDWLKLRANYANGFKMPSAQQIGGDGPFYYVANPSLKPEQARSWELGADIDWRSASASLTYFHTDWKDKILAMAAPGSTCASGWCYQYDNLEEAETAGLEGVVRWDIGQAFGKSYRLAPYASFTWMTTRKNKDSSQFIAYQGPGNDTMPNTPKWMASYGIDYAHPTLKIKSRLNASYYGATLAQDWSGTVSMPAGDQYFSRPSGTVVNWSFEKELAEFSDRFGALTLRAEVNNLFDNANEVYWNYPGAGRNFYVGLRYDFN